MDDVAEPMIQTADLRVDYASTTAVRDLDLSIDAGEVFGLIGPNGAGKTSTIRVLATLLEPTYGDVRIAGIDPVEDRSAVHRVLGYMPDTPPVYDDLKVWEFLDLFAAAHGLSGHAKRDRVEACLRQVNLHEKRHALCGSLSRGMIQRAVLAKTLLHEPRVLLLDEPASALDPIARIELRDTIRALSAQGKTILISSHILTELSDICTSIGIMEKGRMVVSGQIDAIVHRMRRHKLLVATLVAPPPDAAERIAEFEGVANAALASCTLTLEFNGPADAVPDVLAALIAADLRVAAFAEKKMGIEEILLSVGAREVS